ncbi:DEAD/DEAH box helicase family protein [Salmonella enterica subsp. enterica serovar Liverpool]|nr:DEAD/DEAH box helicase family protein [Salmonella enterica subsp. enterica serovar Liverpool]
MAQEMKLQFVQQDYQTTAVNAVVQVFDGQPLAQSDFSLASLHASTSVEYASDGSIGNRLLLSDEQLLANVQKVQLANNLTISRQLIGSKADKGKEIFCPYNFSIEMETGTGKTYTFIKTMYELNKQYGFKKFVVVVPSVAIREGTMKNLEVTKAHFAEQYANTPLVPILYDSSKLTELRHFAQSDALSVLVINIDSFTKDNNKINQKGERAFAPIEYIKAVNPIVIVDEPQNFETDNRRKALMDLNPLCTLRYSATHKNPYNLLYSLNPVQAYDLGLVKQIEVDGVLADANHNEAFIELLSIEQKAKSITAKVRIDVNEKNEVKRKDITLKLGDDLYEKSKQREQYQSGYVLNEFLSDSEIEFSGGRVLRLNEQHGGLADDTMRYQIERTVAAHFAKLAKLKPLGIKVLSLFFIDKVANYRSVDSEGNAEPGKFALWFEAAFKKYAAMPRYQGLIPHAANEVHNGYFSGDKKTIHTPFETLKMRSNATVADVEGGAYALIMKEKERLLSLDEPLQFIFSHSALREGWDNPNVFQICTLNETQSAMKKRQEIGRGLRLPVNQQGERVQDKQINVLTVIPNESYEAFAKALQAEIEDETGVKFEKRIKNARAKARVSKRTLNSEEQALFTAIWQKINYQTRYSVKLNTNELVDKCAELLADYAQFPKVQAPKIRAAKAKILMNNEGVQTVQSGISDVQAASYQSNNVPDVYGYLQNRLHLTRSTLFSILDKSGRLDELLINPQAFLDICVTVISRTLQALMVAGIDYQKINGQRYEMMLFEETLDTYQSSLYPPANDITATALDKTLLQAQPLNGDMQPEGEVYACVPSDSEPENQFALDCATDERVRFFFKLPSKFKIPTPLGDYNPDWAVVFENDERVYFVAETKSSTVEADRRLDENLKIQCGEKHFGLAQSEGVEYKVVTKLEELV